MMLAVDLIPWTDALGQIIDNNLLLLSWLIGRRSTSRLFTCSREIFCRMCYVYGETKMSRQAVILHDVEREAPLGRNQCSIDINWLFAVIHVTTDCPPEDDNNFISCCPHCMQVFDSYLWAGVRYRSQGELSCNLMLSSDQTNADSSDDD